ncbi:hypothetical protein [Glutamicibacter sp.]|uniref:hypothetical protein n=1 Tax=Glutamicibacter sp. TaxID=1931995 RepID=UPI002B47F89F|nr:hypothetical protein [Glutamicibacter sp.]HJX77084.1 hypothetical protein [Glutamicibacter sp.]
MPKQVLRLSLTKDQIADLLNALEDHRDDFRAKAKEATGGLSLDVAYWRSRVDEVQRLLDLVSTSAQLNRP